MTHHIILFIPCYLFLFIYHGLETSALSRRKSGELEEHPGIHFHDEVKENKRDIGRSLAREAKSSHLKKLYEGFYNYRTSKKLNYSLSNSWGAGGMPFNVLYVPNGHQKKMFKSVLKKTFVEERSLNEQKKKIPQVYDLVLQNKKPPPKSRVNTSRKLNTHRKYFFRIPHLFVSYGW